MDFKHLYYGLIMTKCDKCHSFAVNKDTELKLCDVCYYKIPLLDLLAVVHRDGGHYTERYGLQKSVKDAMEIMSDKVVI